jgi:c-di-GMP phosphodiesterase
VRTLDAEASPARGILIARQPIYDADLAVDAYEIVIRGRDGTGMLDANEGTATTAMVRDIGPALVGNRRGFVKGSREFILNGAAAMFPVNRLVTEVSPAVGSDEFLVEAVRDLVELGHEIALEGFLYSEDVLPLLRLATVVKLDIGAFEGDELTEEVARWRVHGARLLAHNVHSHEDFDRCSTLDFTLFQGHFLSTPNLSAGGELRTNSLNSMRLVASLQNPDVELSELQDIIGQDVGLSFKLLRLVNSAFFALPREIESIRDAVVLLGINNIRRWSTLMALTEVEDKPDELLVTGLVRARMCELAASSRGDRDTDAYFTAGLFSVVDALMDSSMVELLSQLPLSPDLSAALLRYEGPKGEVLRGVLAYEQGNDAELGPLASLPAAPSELYSQAVQWATQASGGLSAAVPA